MLPRNLTTIFIVFAISMLCYATHRRAKTAIMVGDALDLIHTYYVDPIDENKLLTAAMNGMTSQLDANSEYIPKDFYESFQNSITQEFVGIGIHVDQPSPDQPVRVLTPLVGSPALKAGMLPGDWIIQIDGQDVSKMTLQQVSDRLKGPLQTTVRVAVRRDKEGFKQEDATSEAIELVIERATIELESVIGDYRDEQNRWVYRLKEDPAIAYVRLTSFGDKTVDELRDVLERLDNDFEAIVLDVRGNSGGLLHGAVEVSDMFLDSGRIVSTRVRGDQLESEFGAQPGTLVANDKPIAVLIDENSASASEIVAAALKDNDRAIVVGVRSFGKGTVQNVLPLEYGRSALRLTVARYYRPNGKNIHRNANATESEDWGVSPSEGMNVALDQPTREALAKRWREASYPSLANATFLDQTADPEDAQTDPTIAVPSGLKGDPQLHRATESLRERIRSKTPDDPSPLPVDQANPENVEIQATAA